MRLSLFILSLLLATLLVLGFAYVNNDIELDYQPYTKTKEALKEIQ